jgi:hypothetical protein
LSGAELTTDEVNARWSSHARQHHDPACDLARARRSFRT